VGPAGQPGKDRIEDLLEVGAGDPQRQLEHARGAAL
jgi:hypothetical protein